MNDQELERKLHTALEHAAPDDVEAVLARLGPQNGKIIPISAPKRRKRILPWIAAACLALAIGGGVAGVRYQQANAVASVVSLDVNPCVRLEVNREEKVLSATPVNDDANQILDGMDLTGTDLEVAVNAIIGSLLKHGYVDELANSVLISVEDDDLTRGAALEEKLTGEISQVLESASINGAILSQSFATDDALQQKAEEYGISQGKAALIQTLVDSSSHLTFESLVGLSINELNLLANSEAAADLTGQNGEQESIRSTGTASQSGYVGVDAATQTALTHAGVQQSQLDYLEADYDYEDGRMVYEVEFGVSGVEYEYDIDAATGAIIKAEQEGQTIQTPAPGQTQQPQGGSSGTISSQQARDIALSNAGVALSDTRELEVELESDDGCYKVEFKSGQYEYEYEISVADGRILSAERDD
ncbi:anti-sigma-I factor RsgI family protein [Flavonifractor sp. An91]|uniref:anti-sigma-I factor RsgI family protein n=1 Tax=Flavonifractor sp. An91 TaxID=1965665 RepID=UPI000B38D978|nr:PepSY domain-containing protein [Flavonifractor sp. An91]OUN14047.1 cell wall protein [Flavonifractor sp. An91]